MKKTFINFSQNRRHLGALPALFVLVMLLGTMSAWGQTWNGWCYKDYTSDGTFTVPAHCVDMYVEAIGGGGGGGNAKSSSSLRARVGTGGGGGAYARKHVTSPSGDYTIKIGAGGGATKQGGTTTVTGSGCNISAGGGGGGASSQRGSTTTGAGGTASVTDYNASNGDAKYSGGRGGSSCDNRDSDIGSLHNRVGSGAGGSAAGGNGNGNYADQSGSGNAGQPQPDGGGGSTHGLSTNYSSTTTWLKGGKGGAGMNGSSGWGNGDAGKAYGGGGGGARDHNETNRSGGAGHPGMVRVWFKISDPSTMTVTASANPETVAKGGSSTLTATAQNYLTGTNFSISYKWNSNANSSTSSTVTLNNLQTSNNYVVTLTNSLSYASHTCARTASNSVDVTVLDAPPTLDLVTTNYTACQGTLVHVELKSNLPSGYDYAVYTDAACTQFSYADDHHMFNKTNSGTQTAYVKIVSGSTTVGTAQAITITNNTHCGSYTDATCTDGTILFKEDFGGNNLSDPTYSLTENANASSAMPFTSGAPAGYGAYSLEKTDDFHLYSIQGNTNTGWCVPGASDHTHEGDPNMGYMMFIDPSFQSVWGPMYTSIIDNLCTGSNLTFSFWVSDLQSGQWDDENSPRTAAPALFDVQLQNPTTGEVLVQTGIWQPDRVDYDNGTYGQQKWQQYGIDFVVPAGLTKVKFVLRNGNYTTESFGNDYAVDDIQVKFCGGKITTSATDASTCSDVHAQLCNTVTLTGTSVFNNPAYKWQYRANASSNWTDVPSSNNYCIETSNSGFYRMFVANSDVIAGVPENGACALKTETDIQLTAYDVDAVDDYFNHVKGSTAVMDLNVFANDENYCGEASVVPGSGPTHGTVTWSATENVFKYTPNTSSIVEDQFEYTFTCHGCNKTATVHISELDMQLGCPTADGNCYSFPNATFQGYATHVTVSFSDIPAAGSSLNLPSYVTTANGFERVDITPYSKKIVLPEGYTAAQIQQLIRDITFCIPAGTHSSVRIGADMAASESDIYYFSGNDHYYRYVPYTSADEGHETWVSSYENAKNSTLYGRKGYLATPTTYEEDIFLTKVSQSVAWLGATRLLNTGVDPNNDQYYLGFNTSETAQTVAGGNQTWYWACGPEKGQMLVDRATACQSFHDHNSPSLDNLYDYFYNNLHIYSNWNGHGQGEPNGGNNFTGDPSIECQYDNTHVESCLTILQVGGDASNDYYTGRGHLRNADTTHFSWNDIGYDKIGSSSSYTARGYIIEYGDQTFGNSTDDVFDASEMVQAVGNIGTFELTAETPVCAGSASTLTATPTFAPYKWYEGTTTTGTPLKQGNDNTFTTPELTADATYTVVANDDQCAQTKTVTVVVTPALSVLTSITTSKETYCFDEEVIFTANDAGGAVTDDLFWSETGCPQATFIDNFHNLNYSYANFREDPTNPTTVTVNENGNIVTHTGGSNVNQQGGNDPHIDMYNIGSFDPNTYKYFQIRYKVTSGNAGGVQLYYLNASHPDANEQHNAQGSLISDGDWHVLTIDASAYSTWTEENITGWRFDFCTAGNVDMEIDYIALTNASYAGPTYTMSNATPGSHTVYVNRIGDCDQGSSTCVSKTVTVNQDFTAGAIATTGQTVCYGGTKNPIGSTTNASGGDGHITYTWYKRTDPSTDEVLVTGATGATYTPEVTEPGTYYYTRYAIDGTCVTTAAQSTGQWKLVILPVVEATITGNDKICNGVTTDLCVPTGAASYSWSKNGTVIADATDNCLTVGATGTYKVTVTAVGGCQSWGTINVTEYDAINAGSILYNLTVCSNTNDTLVKIYGATAASGGAPGGYYEWQMSSDQNFSTYTTIESNTEGYSVPIANSYHKYYRRAYVNDCGTVYTDSVYIINSGTIDAGTIQGSNAEYCAESNVSHTVNVGTIMVASGAPYTVQWQTSPSNTEGSWDDAGSPIASSESDLSYTYTNSSFDGDVYIRYFVTVDGCEPFTGNGVVYLKMNPLPVIAIEDVTTDNVICPSVGTKEITGKVTTPSTANYTYTWSGGLTVTPATTTTDAVQNTVTATIPTTCNATYTVTLNVKDGKNCSAHAVSKTVEVKNTVASTITCASDITQNTEEHKSYYTVTLDDPTYTGNCSPSYEITYSPAMAAETGVSATNASGKYPIGTTTVTYTVTDDCNQTATCSFEVKVNDNEPPCIGCLPPIDPEDPPHDPFDPTLGVSCASISVSGDPTKETDSGKRYFTQNDVEWDVTAWDNSGVAPTMSWMIVNPHLETEPTLPDTVFSGTTNGNTLVGQKFYKGTSKVIWTATDESNQSSSCEFFVVVNDVEPPILTCPTITTDIKCADEVPAPYNNYAAFTYYGGEAWDNDAFVPESFMMFNETKDSPDCTKKITRRYIIRDVNGNEGYCDQEININDNIKPTITGSYPTTAAVAVNNCEFSVPNISENYREYASDNCSGKMFLTMGQVPAANTSIPVTTDAQTITVKVFATDLCDNTSDTVFVTVTVPAQLTLTISDYNSQCYGEDDGYIEYSIAGGKTQYQVDLLGTTTGFQLVDDNNSHRFNNLKDGSYTIKVTDANGCIATNPTAISISQISDNLVVTALSKTWVYDGQAHDTLFYNIDFGSEHYTNIASGASKKLSNGDVVTATISGTITNVNESPVANEVASVTVTRNDETITCFYNQDLVDGELNITKAGSDKVTINCPTVAADRTWVYNAQPHSVAVTASSTIVGTDVFTITYSEDGTNYNLTECPTITNVGTKHVWVKAHNDNYEDATCDFVMEITKAGPDKQNLECPNVADSNWVYDGNDHFAYATANPIGHETPTIEYSLDSTNWTPDAQSIKYVTESPKHVYVRSLHPNYEDAACGFDLVISPADDIHVQMNCPTAENSTWQFDGTAHFVTVTATSDIVGTDEFEITYSTDGGTTWSATRPERTDAGETNVTVKAHNPNYEDATCTYTLTVTQKPVTIEVTATLPYNGWQQVVKYDGTVGYYDGQQVSYDSQIVNPDPQGNNQSVNAPVVTVTVTGLIDNDYLTGGEMVTSDYHVGQYTYNYAPTMALGLMAPVTGTLSMVTPFTSEKGIGNYAVTYKLKADIVKRVLDLTADDASKTYDGTALTNNGYTVTGGSVATTDNVASIMHTGEQLCVGTSAHGISGAMIQRNTEDVTDQYTITYNAGTLTVNNYTGLECPVAETVTLNYGECDITYVITGTPALTDPTAIAAGKYSFINNIAFLNPLPVGDNDITWYLLDACGDTMTTCTQTVTVNYPTCPDAEDNEHHIYHSVRIGCDCWTVRNLESEKYADGTDIPDVMTYYAPMYYSDQAYNLATYGHLYTWQAAIKDGSVNTYGHVPGICPAGWYLPTKEQYEGLNAYGPDALRATSTLWVDGGGTNTTGFTGLPGGKYAGALDRYEDMTIKDYYWSTSNASGSITPAEVELTMNCLIVKDVPTSNSNGYSIRCIKEKE